MVMYTLPGEIMEHATGKILKKINCQVGTHLAMGLMLKIMEMSLLEAIMCLTIMLYLQDGKMEIGLI